MPRSKPSKTEVVRFELGSWERQRLDGLSTALTFRSILAPFTSLSGLLVLITVTISLMYAFIPAIRDFIDEEIIEEFIKNNDKKGLSDYLDAQNIAATAVGLLIPGGVLVKIGRVLLGNLGIEALEEGYEFIEDQIVEPGIGQKLFVELVQLKIRLQNLEKGDFRIGSFL